MEVVLCLDKNGGMLFNNRRQSRDVKVLEDILFNLGDKKLYISSFSEELFVDFSDKVTVVDNFSDNANEDGVCFVENIDVGHFADKISKITVYNWNRVYPVDTFCTVNFKEFKKIGSTDFKGNSHEKITKAVYIKK